MPERQTGNDGHSKGPQSFLKDGFQCLAVFPGAFCFWVSAVFIDANGDAGDLLQHTGIEQMGEHPIEAVRRLFQILKEKNFSLKRWLIGRAQSTAEQRKISADQLSRRPPAP